MEKAFLDFWQAYDHCNSAVQRPLEKGAFSLSAFAKEPLFRRWTFLATCSSVFVMKHIHVTCALIERDGKVLSTQRSASMSLPLKWEFPGGKIHDGELPEECLKRELREELGIEVAVGRSLSPVNHQYPAFIVTLYPFICRITAGDIELHEHKAFKWLPPEALHELDWAEADTSVIREYISMYKSSR